MTAASPAQEQSKPRGRGRPATGNAKYVYRIDKESRHGYQVTIAVGGHKAAKWFGDPSYQDSKAAAEAWRDAKLIEFGIVAAPEPEIIEPQLETANTNTGIKGITESHDFISVKLATPDGVKSRSYSKHKYKNGLALELAKAALLELKRQYKMP